MSPFLGKVSYVSPFLFVEVQACHCTVPSIISAVDRTYPKSVWGLLQFMVRVMGQS
jgi:hypothetical protein